MDYHYTLFIDEAGDDKVERLKPENPDGNSEWLCLGGYLIRADVESDLDRRRDDILTAIGSKAGGVLHFQKLHPKNRVKAVQTLATKANAARGFVVCSCKQTMLDRGGPGFSTILPPRQALAWVSCQAAAFRFWLVLS